MSYILDALKRSDRSRQINTTHEMSYSHLHTEKNHENTWLKVCVAALSIALLSMIAFLFVSNKLESYQPPEIPASRTLVNYSEPKVVVEPQAIQVENQTKIEASPAPDVSETAPVIAETINSGQNILSSRTIEPETNPRRSLSDLVIEPSKIQEVYSATPTVEILALEPGPSVTLSSEIEAQLSTDDLANVSAADFSSYMNYREIKSKYSLPEMHLDILMYHSSAASRKAYINMSKYQEGDTTSQGAELLEIGPKEVLMRYSGQEFVLSAK